MQGRSSAQLSSNILSAPSMSQRSACAERRPGFPPARAPLAPLLDPRPSQQLRLPGSPRGSRVSLSLAPHLGSRGAVVTRSLHRTLTTPAVSPAKLATDAYALASPNSPSVQEDVLLASASLVVCMSSLGLLNTHTGRRHVGAAARFSGRLSHQRPRCPPPDRRREKQGSSRRPAPLRSHEACPQGAL